MKRVILTSLWLAVVSYLCITGIFGNSGLIAIQNASRISMAMEANIRTLQDKNSEYKADLNRLADSPEMIAREGRSLGYLGVNEVAVTIKNKKIPAANVANAGFLLNYTPPLLCQNKTARLYALALGGMVFFAYGLILILKKRTRS